MQWILPHTTGLRKVVFSQMMYLTEYGSNGSSVCQSVHEWTSRWIYFSKFRFCPRRAKWIVASFWVCFNVHFRKPGVWFCCPDTMEKMVGSKYGWSRLWPVCYTLCLLYIFGAFAINFSMWRILNKDRSFQIITALNKSWHPDHFVCLKCDKPISGQTFNEKDGNPICSDCFLQYFSEICASCKKPIKGVSYNDFVTRLVFLYIFQTIFIIMD